jgi:hypothetical protein
MDVTTWLLDADPAIRWQVLRDVVGADDATVKAERSRVAREGWGAVLLELQTPDGRWDGGVYRPGWAQEDRPFFDAWTGTHFTLCLLRELGADPVDPRVVQAIARVRDGVRWEANGAPYFVGEVEPCVNGLALANAAWFGEDGGPIVARLVADQLDDGGWNCVETATVASFHSTICALEGLLAWELTTGATDVVRAARLRGEAYLLERRLLRRRSDGGMVDPRFAMPSFPTWWYYDALRALDHLRAASLHTGVPPDPRCDEAIELLRAKRLPDGRWRNELTHEGPVFLRVEASEGSPGRWATLRALRVLAWWDDTERPGAMVRSPARRGAAGGA